MKNKSFDVAAGAYRLILSTTLFTHLCTKYLYPTKPRVSYRPAMAQHQVHGALVLLYCMIIWSAIGVLFSFGGRLFSRDWSLLRATLISSLCWLALFH